MAGAEVFVMKTLHGAPNSVFVRKVRILLQEKGIAFVSNPVNPMLELDESFKAISPLGKIPVFQDEEYIIADSSAICAYIDKQYPTPSFYPIEAKALGQALWFEEYADTALFQAIAPCYYQTILVPRYRNRAPDKNAIDNALTHQLPPIADYLEKNLVGKKYLVDNTFTIADVAVGSIFMNMILAGFPLPDRWSNLKDYLNNLFQRDSFRSSITLATLNS